jgi:uroporphyrinogen-III decarboxylase
MGTLDDPAKTRRILDRLLPVTLQIDAGADCILLADHATRDLCSPGTYRDFLLPLHQRLAAEIKVPVILHIGGNTADRIGMVAQTGVSCFHWDTKTGRPDEVRALAGPRLALMGGVSNFTLLRSTAEEVAAQVQAAVAGDIDVIGPECAIPLTTPLANLQAITTGKSP